MTFDGASYEVRSDETLLDAFLRGGANLSFSCRRGTCHVCMLKAERGDPGPEAGERLSPEQRRAGLFLCCQARPTEDLVVARPDPSTFVVRAHIQAHEELSASVVRLLLEPETTMSWRAGQLINVRHPSGAWRSYSLASISGEDYFLELHVRRIPGGLVSGWLCNDLRAGDTVELRGPSGACFYDPELRDRELLLIAGGTGLAPLMGIVRDALRQGHRGSITLLHGSTRLDGIYQHEHLRALAAAHPLLRYEAWLDDQGKTHDLPEGIEHGRVVDAAFSKDRSGVVLYLAGPPDMVYEARHRAVAAGIDRAETHADPFEDARPYMPDDKAKLARVPADPEIWQALEQGPGLTRILEDFYGRVYEDPRLSPFFRDATKARAIEKQYEFLRDLFTGSRTFFGARPFNAHHWMVISDELFDYREALFIGALRRYGLPERLIRRWSSLHELFRRELVKTRRRGMVIDGEEWVEQEGYHTEIVTIGTLCDGCGEAIDEGATARHHVLSGKLYCTGCEATAAQ